MIKIKVMDGVENVLRNLFLKLTLCVIPFGRSVDDPSQIKNEDGFHSLMSALSDFDGGPGACRVGFNRLTN